MIMSCCHRSKRQRLVKSFKPLCELLPRLIQPRKTVLSQCHGRIVPAMSTALSNRYSSRHFPSCHAIIFFFCLPVNFHHFMPSGVTYAPAGCLPPRASVQTGGGFLRPTRGCRATVVFTIGNRYEISLRSRLTAFGAQRCLFTPICLSLCLNWHAVHENVVMNAGSKVTQNSQ